MDSPSTRIALCRCALASGTPLRLRIRGTSMLPALWSGDAVSVVAANPADVGAGDVVAFARNGHLVVHRVVRRASGSGRAAIVTRGDTRLDEDPPVDASELLGVVTAVHRFGADRPVDRRPPALARAVAWTVRRSALVRTALDRLNGLIPARRPAPARRAGESGVQGQGTPT
jgi:signal peptidase I